MCTRLPYCIVPLLSICSAREQQLPAAWCPWLQPPLNPAISRSLGDAAPAAAALSAESPAATQAVPAAAALRVPGRACRRCAACRSEASSSSWSWQRQGQGYTLRVHGHLALWPSTTVTTSSLRFGNYTHMAPACVVLMLYISMHARRMLSSRSQHPRTVRHLLHCWCRAPPGLIMLHLQPA